jgi:hypothetical protein
LANQRIVDDLREAVVEEMSADEAKDLLRKLQDKIV